MIWNAHTENKLLAIPLKSAWVMTCAYSPSSTYISCGGLDNRVSVYRLNEHSIGYNDKKIEPYHCMESHEGYISCIRFWDDQHLISSGTASWSWNVLPLTKPYVPKIASLSTVTMRG